MSENSEQTTVDEQQIVQPVSYKRILFVMAAATVLGAILSFVYISAKFAFGILFGGILSVVNFYWLKHSLKGLFEKVIRDGEKPLFIGATYFLRYFVFGLILAIVYLTEIVPVIALLSGLASLAIAITVEGFIRLFSSFFKKRENI